MILLFVSSELSFYECLKIKAWFWRQHRKLFGQTPPQVSNLAQGKNVFFSPPSFAKNISYYARVTYFGFHSSNINAVDIGYYFFFHYFVNNFDRYIFILLLLTTMSKIKDFFSLRLFARCGPRSTSRPASFPSTGFGSYFSFEESIQFYIRTCFSFFIPLIQCFKYIVWKTYVWMKKWVRERVTYREATHIKEKRN